MNTTNKGILTEQQHFDYFSNVFKGLSITNPKGFAGGSDFIIQIPQIGNVSFESKTSNNDLFDAGVVTTWANGAIQSISGFYTNNQINEIQRSLHEANVLIREHLSFVDSDKTSYTTLKSTYEEIKQQNKLIVLKPSAPDDLIESAFTGANEVKANYIVIGTNVFRSSAKAEHDPLNLRSHNVPVLNNDLIKNFEIRSRRGGSSGPEKKVRVSLRLSYKLQSKLPESSLKLDQSFEYVIKSLL